MAAMQHWQIAYSTNSGRLAVIVRGEALARPPPKRHCQYSTRGIYQLGLERN